MHPHLMITPHDHGPAEADVALCEQELAEAHTLGSAEDIDAAEDALNHARTASRRTFTANLTHTAFEVENFAVEQVDGCMIATLQFEVSGVQAGDPPADGDVIAPELRPAVPPKNEGPAVWGKPGPDPRENIAGWQPEEQQIKVEFRTDEPGDRLIGALRDLIRIRFRGDGGAAPGVRA